MMAPLQTIIPDTELMSALRLDKKMEQSDAGDGYFKNVVLESSKDRSSAEYPLSSQHVQRYHQNQACQLKIGAWDKNFTSH